MQRVVEAVRRGLGPLALLACAAAPSCAAQVAADLALPASFKGVLPCRDCDAVQAQLDLWSDGVFHLRRALVGKPGNDDELGRWRKDPSRPAILLYGGREMPLQIEIVGPRTLRLLEPAVPSLPTGGLELVSDGTLLPAELRLSLHGMFRYMADAARFEECLTGRSYPVAMEGDYLALERAYLAARSEPGAPLMASFDGRIVQRPPMEGPGPVPTVVVDRFIGVWPNQTCERAMSRASFADQYWRVVRLYGRPVAAASGQREAHIVLRGREGSYAGSVGCASFSGVYRVDGSALRLQRPAPAVPPACPAAGAAAEGSATRWYEALEATRRWSINAQVMEWFDERGCTVALFEAVYLR